MKRSATSMRAQRLAQFRGSSTLNLYATLPLLVVVTLLLLQATPRGRRSRRRRRGDRGRLLLCAGRGHGRARADPSRHKPARAHSGPAPCWRSRSTRHSRATMSMAIIGHVGSCRDPATARRGEYVLAFVARTVVHQSDRGVASGSGAAASQGPGHVVVAQPRARRVLLLGLVILWPRRSRRRRRGHRWCFWRRPMFGRLHPRDDQLRSALRDRQGRGRSDRDAPCLGLLPPRYRTRCTTICPAMPITTCLRRNRSGSSTARGLAEASARIPDDVDDRAAIRHGGTR